MPALKEFLTERLDEYGLEPGAAPMDLVLFRDALHHICRCARVSIDCVLYIVWGGCGCCGGGGACSNCLHPCGGTCVRRLLACLLACPTLLTAMYRFSCMCPARPQRVYMPYSKGRIHPLLSRQTPRVTISIAFLMPQDSPHSAAASWQCAACGGGRQRAQEPGQAGCLRGGAQMLHHRDHKELQAGAWMGGWMGGWVDGVAHPTKKPDRDACKTAPRERGQAATRFLDDLKNLQH